MGFGRGVLLYLLAVPIPIILLLACSGTTDRVAMRQRSTTSSLNYGAYETDDIGC